MSDQTLHNRLIKLGDMMGDGLHHEPDGKWISKEYNATLRALGIARPRRNNRDAINTRMQVRVTEAACTKCGGALVQTRSGSKRARCGACQALFKLLK